MATQSVDWANRWVGGFCALAAVGGLPVRSADYSAHPPLAAALPLPVATRYLAAEPAAVRQAWSEALGGAPVVLVRNAACARSLLLAAAGVEAGEAVGVPANSDRELVESIKHHGARPVFFELSHHLAPPAGSGRHSHVRFSWAQPIGGVGGSGAADWIDCADTLPSFAQPTAWPTVTVFGLHLADDPRHAGALLVFGDAALAEAVAARVAPEDEPEPNRALVQLWRLLDDGAEQGLTAKQRAALAETRHGLRAAAGLALLDAAPAGALAEHIAVRIPDESDPATFYAYVAAERTPVRWLPLVRPLHYAATRERGRCAATAAELARWLLVPVGPDYSAEEIAHAVLGVVKAAEYLGVRWRSDPARAAEYAGWMDELYGPGHDAYRPVFDVNDD